LPLYEIVLRYADRDELRLTDRDPRADGHVRINGAVLPIIATREGSTKRVARRYIVAVENNTGPRAGRVGRRIANVSAAR
jgi:hypothetical protein